ncbi:acetyl-CoA acetyltransferase 2 isoform X2 [Populus alba]|uniref:acetyl-CoA acetyltransferase 2 isoform X2 n=1 Tax=Populus alba TaxID=43335 RepID=UPI003CC79642
MASSDSIKPRDVCIVGVARTPMGGFLGSLSSFTATKLGSIAIQCALQRANIDPSLVQEVFFGNVLSANLGQAPARQAALGAGIPNSVICTTINKVCASGMKATMLAAQTIQLGINDVVVAGGMESMSNAPKYLADARKGSRLGHDTIVDGMMKDGLWDVYNDFGMGVCAEICADQHSIIRDDQDSYAIQSFERGIAAQNSGHFSWEVVPVEVSGGRGKPSTIVDKDDGLGKFDAAKLRKLRPSFKENGGSVTAGNASSISDGAAALVLMSGEKALKLRLQVIAKIRGYADAAQAPELFTTAPALAIPKAISNAGLEASQVDFYEINEAFSVVALANQKLLGLNPVLKHKNGKYGVGGICNGGGGASALVLELIDGAAALVPMSGEKALKLGLQVIAKIRGYADAAQAPELFTTAPALAIPKAISNAGLEASQIDFCEINEAFSVVALANQKLLGLNPQKVKAHGGAVSLGHPLGCSGARILVTLLGVTYIVAYSYLLWVCFFPYGLSEHCCVIYLSLNPHLCMFGFSVGYKVSL